MVTRSISHHFCLRFHLKRIHYSSTTIWINLQLLWITIQQCGKRESALDYCKLWRKWCLKTWIPLQISRDKLLVWAAEALFLEFLEWSMDSFCLAQICILLNLNLDAESKYETNLNRQAVNSLEQALFRQDYGWERGRERERLTNHTNHRRRADVNRCFLYLCAVSLWCSLNEATRATSVRVCSN